jgi:hypothetical protein
MKGKTFMAALLSVAATAHAAHWEPIARLGDRSMYLATDRISKHEDEIDVWVKTVFNESQVLPSGETYEFVLSEMSISCASTSTLTETSTPYRSDGTSIVTTSPDEGWKPAAPDTSMERLVKRICEG